MVIYLLDEKRAIKVARNFGVTLFCDHSSHFYTVYPKYFADSATICIFAVV